MAKQKYIIEVIAGRRTEIVKIVTQETKDFEFLKMLARQQESVADLVSETHSIRVIHSEPVTE